MRSGDRLTPGTPRAAGGFTYLLVLFAVAALGLSLAGTGEVWRTVAQREREAELLFIGNQFRQALASYHSQSPDGTPRYPAQLEDLLVDPRLPSQRRHLRRIYRDPMTHSFDWGLVRVGGRIVGVHSLSTSPTLKTAFDERDADLQGAAQYDQWVFRPVAASPAPPPAPGQAPQR
jgi:type II secretory pathway pseudopilin PulG